MRPYPKLGITDSYPRVSFYIGSIRTKPEFFCLTGGDLSQAWSFGVCPEFARDVKDGKNQGKFGSCEFALRSRLELVAKGGL
jgi:hypothetical protein